MCALSCFSKRDGFIAFVHTGSVTSSAFISLPSISSPLFLTLEHIAKIAARPKQDAIEVSGVEAEVCADALFRFTIEVEARQQLPIPQRFHKRDGAPHALALLLAKDVRQLTRIGIRDVQRVLFIDFAAPPRFAPARDE